MDNRLKYQFLMSQLTHIRDIKETEKTKLSLVFYEGSQSACVLRICKGRDLSAVCDGLRKIKNPNAVFVYDYVYNNGDTYILEENISGSSVEQLLDEKGVLSEKETAGIIMQVCNALESLHREDPPVVHNDINPSNIMVREDGTVKLFDFDISRLYKKGAGQNTVLFGTEEYASPEHYGYGQSEPRTDIYCLGATMHKMLTGEVLSPEHRITYRGRLKPILEKCLQFDPRNRYASVGALRKELERFLAGKKRVFPWLFLSVGVVALAVVLAFLLWKPTTPQQLPWESQTQTAQETVLTTVAQDTNDTKDTIPPSASGTPAESTKPASPTDPEKKPEETTQPTQAPTPVKKNDTRANAELIQVGKTYNETIEENKVPDWYRFVTGAQLSVYRIYLGPRGSDPVNGRTIMQLYDSGGKEVKKLNLDYNKAGFVDVLLKTNAEYAIKVSGENTVPALGNYKLQISQRKCDAGTSEASATPLKLDTLLTARADSTLEDYFVFTVPQSGSYKIDVQNMNVGAKITYSGKRNGGSLFSGWAGDGAATSRTFNAQAGDVIYIVVDAGDSSANGQYSLLISLS